MPASDVIISQGRWRGTLRFAEYQMAVLAMEKEVMFCVFLRAIK